MPPSKQRPATRRSRRGRAPNSRDVPERSAPPLDLERASIIAGRVLVVALAFVAVLWLIATLLLVFTSVFVALLIAAALLPPASRLKRRGWRPGLATWVVVMPAYLGFFAIVYLLGAAVAGQFADLGQAFGEGIGEIREWLMEGPLELTEAELQEYSASALEQVRDAAEDLTEHIATGAVVAAEIVAGSIIAMVLAFFFVKDAERFTGWFMHHVPADHVETVRAAGARAWESLGGYLRGTIVVSTVDAIGIGVGLLLVGVPLVVPLMFLTFIGGFFPIVGATVAGAVAVVVALVSVGPAGALIILGVVIAVQQIESNFLEPVVLARAVPLHPVVIIVMITTGAIVGGIVGAFLAVPVAAVVSSVGNELRIRGVLLPNAEDPERPEEEPERPEEDPERPEEDPERPAHDA